MGQGSCTRFITLASVFSELFPFVNFLKEPGQVTHVFHGTPNSSYDKKKSSFLSKLDGLEIPIGGVGKENEKK